MNGLQKEEWEKRIVSICELIFFITVSMFALSDSNSWAGEYVLIKGKGVEVCEAYMKNLNSFDLDNQYIMACKRKINPKYADFKKPEWEQLDLQENVELLKKIELFLGNYVVTSENEKGWKEYIESQIMHKRVSIKSARLDIFNNGKIYNVIKYVEEGCASSRHYGASLLVLNNSEDDIDIEKTIPLLQNIKVVPDSPLSEGWEFAMYDVFVYKNKSYFDQWSGNQWPGGKVGKEKIKLLKVFVTEEDKVGHINTKEICRYKFR